MPNKNSAQESNEVLEHPFNERSWKGESVMSAEITGMQPQKTNDKNPHALGSSETHSRGVPDTHELTPDRPPQPVEAESVADRKPKRARGFAAMDRKLVSEIARKGGKAAHSAGTAHEFSSEEARVAGQRGGRATHAKRRRLLEGQGKPPSESQGG
jgi:general stress protein YciG